MAHTIGIGESIVIPQREITEDLHTLRRTRALAPTNHLKNGTKAKILRAYSRPRGQLSVSIETTDTEVKVTALVMDDNDVDVTELGRVVVDVIDEISEPWGHDYEIYVVREPQLKSAEPVLVKATAPAPIEVKSDLG